ncbi:hypothetical protein H7827_21760 [Streptomyces sp. JH002]|uniref:hypothetical protein n=1 Tax=Streptomyces TaxID=1883 RepID=UPI0036C96DB4
MRIRHALATAAAGTALAVGALTAPAAQAAEPAVNSGPITAQGWEYYSWYWTYANCTNEGQRLVATSSVWRDYKCEPHATNLTVLLYLLR